MQGSERLSFSSLLFFVEVVKKLNEFLLVFQTDKSITPFLTETLEDVIKTFEEINLQRPS